MMLTLRILAICLLAGAMLWSPAEPHSAGLRPLFSAEPNGVALNRVSREIGPDGGYQEATDAVFDFAPPYGQADDLEGRRTRQALLWIAANSEQSHRLPWQTWLLEERRNRPEFAAELFLAAQKALGKELIPVAEQMDQRDTPTPLRIVIHQFWWTLSPILGRNKSGALLLRETPRANDLHARLIAEVVNLSPSLEAEELLTDFALYSRGEERARRLAIRALGARDAKSAVPFLSSLVLGENRNALLFKEAMLAVLELSPEDGRNLLLDLQADPSTQPVVASFLNTLREANGLSTQ